MSVSLCMYVRVFVPCKLVQHKNELFTTFFMDALLFYIYLLRMCTYVGMP